MSDAWELLWTRTQPLESSFEPDRLSDPGGAKAAEARGISRYWSCGTGYSNRLGQPYTGRCASSRDPEPRGIEMSDVAGDRPDDFVAAVSAFLDEVL